MEMSRWGKMFNQTPYKYYYCILYIICSVHDIPLVYLPRDVNGNVKVVKRVKCM